jgi:hypothetical protein
MQALSGINMDTVRDINTFNKNVWVAAGLY